MPQLTDESERPLTNSGKQPQIVFNQRQNGDNPVSQRDMPLNYYNEEGKRLVEIFIGEFTGTGLLVLLGCMSSIVWSESMDLHPWQGSVVFAVVVTTIITIFGHITAAHLNPAVTLCFYILGDVTALQAIVYFFAEVLGSIAGFGILKFITPCDIYELSMQYTGDKVCVTYPHEKLSDLQTFAAEFLATSVLILVVCSCSDVRNASNIDTAPLKFGATILALCIAESPYTGASMNPARSLGPVVWTGAWDKHWIYWLSPLSAGLFATIFYLKIFGVEKTPPLIESGKEHNRELRSVTSH